MIYTKDNLLGSSVPFDGKYIFLDIETANNILDICQIGAIVIENKQIVKVIDEYVKPLGKFNYKKYHSDLHGITPEMVKNSLTFKQIWEDKFSFYDNEYIIVAHNAASADLPALATDFYAYNINIDIINYIDTIKIAKQLMLPIKHYSRENICDFLKISINNNHNALSDAIDCLNIFIALTEKFNVTIEIDYFNPKTYIRIDRTRLSKNEILATIINSEKDKDFDGKVCVLTGIFERFPSRKIAEAEIRKRGGKTAMSISGATNLLICGADSGPEKIKQAKIRKENGQDITIVDEATFYKMLESNEAITEN